MSCSVRSLDSLECSSAMVHRDLYLKNYYFQRLVSSNLISTFNRMFLIFLNAQQFVDLPIM